MEGVFHPRLFLLHFNFRCRTDFDHGDTAHQFGQPLLKLFPIVIGCRFLDLCANLLDPPFDVGLLPAPSTIVVLSLVICSRLQVPRSVSVMLSS
jgi:hypothetical protein